MRKMKSIGSVIVLFAMTVFMSACLDTDIGAEVQQLENEKLAIYNYLTANPPTTGSTVIYDPSGVVIVFSQLGTGIIPPNQDNQIVVAYTGSIFSSGAVFQTNNYFATYLKDQIISGWKIALAQMTQGAKAKVYIPSFYAYGTNGRADGQVPIPGNSTLVFDLELKSVNATLAQRTLLESQTAAIDSKLAALEIENVVQLDSGVRIVHHVNPDVGSKPTLYDQITFKVTGKLLSDGSVFSTERTLSPEIGFDSRVINYVHGMIIGLQAMRVGGKASIYVPAMLGYGSESRPGVPIHSNLLFEVELITIDNP